MLLKNLINKSVYGTIGYITSQDDIDLLERYILYNLSVLKEFKQIVVATNYKELDLQLINKHIDMWEKYFPNCFLIDSKINRGHNHGYTDLDNLVFDWCKGNNEEWLCKSANDIIIEESILDKQIEEADFYYLCGFGYAGFYEPYNYTIETATEAISDTQEFFYPQTNFYFINISKTDYLNNKEYLDETYECIQSIPDYNGKIWEYINGWSCEDFLKQCIERNNLSKYNLVSKEKYRTLLQIIKYNQIQDSSHKNIMIEGICHYQDNNSQIIKI
jgi:hypothetical protein